MKLRTYILAGGGSGGHLYPGLAIAEALLQRHEDNRVVFFCSQREIDEQILSPTRYAMAPQPVIPLRRSVTGPFKFAFRYWRSHRQAKAMLERLVPAGVLGLGGYVSVPMTRLAGKLGFRSAILNPDAVPGRANRMLAKHVEGIFTQFEETRGQFPEKVRDKIVTTGCPVRRELFCADRSEAIRHFELDPNKQTLLVFGASLGAATINEAMMGILGDLRGHAETWQVLWIAGANQAAPTDVADRGIAIRTLPYCERMDLAYAAADLALCRAGASSIAELIATHTPAVLMPYPYHKDDHQSLNAQPLVRAGSAVICPDTTELSRNLSGLREHLLGVMSAPDRLGEMRQAASQFGVSDAAESIAKWLCPFD
jgi:UDP-N-acetylglucosamine--N-acetylmuramyl-(pentapeptide) pyrophosphoryl-undecaprenol N-acetylglucosamine transferase